MVSKLKFILNLIVKIIKAVLSSLTHSQVSSTTKGDDNKPKEKEE